MIDFGIDLAIGIEAGGGQKVAGVILGAGAGIYGGGFRGNPFGVIGWTLYLDHYSSKMEEKAKKTCGGRVGRD